MTKKISDISNYNEIKNIIDEFGNLNNRIISKIRKSFAYEYINEKIPSHVPTSLYKYTTLNFYTLQNLYHKTITLTRPLLFNDPFDSLFYESKKEQPLVVQRGYIKEDMKKRLEKHIHSIPLYKTMSRGQQLLRVASLTERNDNYLMWSLYSDNDRGICISYDIPHSFYKYTPLSKFVFPIIYIKKPFDFSEWGDFNYASMKEELIELGCSGMVKSKSWDYEQEWRIMIPLYNVSRNTDRVLFYRPNINKIYLGPNFIGYWLWIKMQSYSDPSSYNKLHSYFYPFCRFVRSHKIQLKIMKLVPSKYKLKDQIISVRHLRKLDLKDKVLQKYFNVDFLGRY